MSPVTRVFREAPGCSIPPLPAERLCAGHYRLSRAFGRTPERVASFETMKAAGSAFDADSPEFDRELREWLGEAR